MALDSHHASFLREVHELLLECLISRSHHKAYVHDRAVFLGSCSNEERIAVNLVIKDGSLLLVHLVYCLNSTKILDPLESFLHHEDREYWRRVEH